MVKVYFSCNWGEDKKTLLKRMSWMTPNNCGKWGSLIGVTNIQEADFIVVMNGLSGEMKEVSQFLYQVHM